MVTRSMVTTIDNPHSPFDNFAAWYAYDVSSGYHTSALLARITMTTDDLSEEDYDLAVEQAVDSVVKENVLGVFIKVTKEFDE